MWTRDIWDTFSARGLNVLCVCKSAMVHLFLVFKYKFHSFIMSHLEFSHYQYKFCSSTQQYPSTLKYRSAGDGFCHIPYKIMFSWIKVSLWVCEFLHIVNVLKFNELILFGRRPFFLFLISSQKWKIWFGKIFQNGHDITNSLSIVCHIFDVCITMSTGYRYVFIDQSCTTFMLFSISILELISCNWLAG